MFPTLNVAQNQSCIGQQLFKPIFCLSFSFGRAEMEGREQSMYALQVEKIVQLFLEIFSYFKIVKVHLKIGLGSTNCKTVQALMALWTFPKYNFLAANYIQP